MTNIDDLNNKIENQGKTEQGKLSALEWNTLVDSVVELQELPEQIASKIGYLYRTPVKQDDNLYHIFGFESQEVYNEWLESEDDALILANISLPAQEATAASNVVSLVNGSGSTLVSTDNTVTVKVRFVSVLYNPIDQSQTDTNETGILSVYTRLNESYEWQKKGEVRINSLPKESEAFTSVDISNYCANGTQQVRLVVRGVESGLTTTAIVLSVTKTEFKIEFAGQWQNIITSAALPLSYYIQGSVANKKVNLLIDDKRSVVYEIGEATYIQTPYSTTIQDIEGELNPICTQGVHTVEAWLSVTVDGATIESDHIKNELLIVLDENDASPTILLQDVQTVLVNWTNQLLFRYSVYNPKDDILDITFNLCDYNRSKIYGQFSMGEVREGIQYAFENMIEIEETLQSFSARLDIINNADGSRLKELVFRIDNAQNFSPTAGADFIMNPKLRTNDETNPNRIINVVNGEEIPATFTNFGFTNDGWVTDENGIKCLRVLAGGKLDIDYEAFSGFMSGNNTNSLTIEFDIATRNVVNEEEPIIKMCTYNPSDSTKHYGMEFRPMEGCFMTANKQVRLDQDIMWQEGVRTHIAINIVHNLANSGINYIRIFINGCINREIDYAATDTFVQLIDGERTSHGIRIGASQAEIDIYGIRIYKTALSTNDVQQDYVASLSTSDEKIAFREANDITVNGLINYEKTKVKYNTMLWKPNARTVGNCRLAAYGDKSKQLQYGDMDVIILGDPKHSGSFYNMNTQGQGTSAMSYWKWNQRIQFDEDGYFVNEDGDTYTGVYQLEDGLPFATRLDGKLNWASSMQSHKVGATALYHDLWKKIIGSNDITTTDGGQSFTGTEGGYADCRVAVKQKPFMMFVQETAASDPVFYGLYTWGPGKGDKPTFGYDKKVFPNYTMIEGCDNNMPMVMHRVPWDSYIPGDFLADEIATYNGLDNWELSMGSGKLWEDFREAFNFVYLLHDDIHPYVGTYAQLVTDRVVNKDQDFWVTTADSNAAKFDLFRYDQVDEAWVPAGLDRTVLNLNQQCGNVASNSEVDWDAVNAKFIAKRVELFQQGISNYFHVNDLLYTTAFLIIVCGTDNRGKNTYLYKVNKDSKIMFLQDDLDTIFLNNNVGKKTKPYYIEVFDKNADGEYYWTSTRNALYNLTQKAFPTELRAMTKNILSVMSDLGGGTLDKCFEKYFTSVQEYFPATAFNESARLLYEEAAIAVSDGRYNPNTLPLPQSLGNLLEAEKAWIQNRIDFMSSYAGFGKYDSGEQAGALTFRSIVTRDGSSPKYEFTLTPHKWLYPSIGVGDSAIWSGVRIPAGQAFRFPALRSDGNTNIRILDINKYRHIGTWGDKSVGEGFLLSGERLTEFVASAQSPEFRPTSMQITARNIEKLDLNGISTLVGALDLSKLVRLREVDLRGTKLTSVTLPNSDALQILHLPATLTSVKIDNQPNLATVTFEGYNALTEVYIDMRRAGALNSLTIAQNIYQNLKNSNSQIQSTYLNVDWTNVSIDMFMWYTEVQKEQNTRITGKISIFEPSVYTNVVTFDRKNSINRRWGNVDIADSVDHKGLLLQYQKSYIDAVDDVELKGAFYNNGEYYHNFYIYSKNPNYNNHLNIIWSIERQPTYDSLIVSIDSASGVLYVDISALPAMYDYIIIRSTIQYLTPQGQVAEIQLDRTVELYDREIQIGDYMLADGSYCSPSAYDGTKTIVAKCFYKAPVDVNGNPIYPGDGSNSQDKTIYKHKILGIAPIMNDKHGWGPWRTTASETDGLYFNVINSDGTVTKQLLSANSKITGAEVLDSQEFYVPTGVSRQLKKASTGSITSQALRDEESVEGILNGGFKLFDTNTYEGYGLTNPSETQAQIQDRTLTAELAELAGSRYKEGDVVSCGYIDTLRTIAHRNKILASHIVPVEGEDFSMELQIPEESADKLYTEYESTLRLSQALSDRMRDLQGEKYPDKWKQIYHLTASLSYSYEPQVKVGEVLADKYKKHNWFTPTSGQLIRFWYYLVNNQINDEYFSVIASLPSTGLSVYTSGIAGPTNAHEMNLRPNEVINYNAKGYPRNSFMIVAF